MKHNPCAGSGNDDMLPLLRTVELFASLDAEELRAVAAHSRWLSVAQGGALFTGQDDVGRLYAVKDGEVLITRQGDEGRDISLATFVGGDSFGELGLFETQPGGTAARAERDSALLVFPGSDSAERFFAEHPAIAAKVLRRLLGVVARRIRSANRLIAEKSPWVQELRRQVMIDKLTGLYNAGFLEEDLARMVEARRSGVCLLMIKPDNFKTVNDTYGHDGGDRALQLMARALRERLGDQGVAVRYRGDVLAAVLPECELPAARRIAGAVRREMKAVDLREISGGAPLTITVSVGVSCCGAGCRLSAGSRGSAAALVEGAYENLFTARNRGGDRLCASGRRHAGNG